MPISTAYPKSSYSNTNDMVVASLREHIELGKRLVYDIETDYLSPEALRFRLAEIESHGRFLKSLS